MSLSIVIVNYKTPQLLADCLHTVYAQTKSIDFEVIVVDNASGDDSHARITQEFPAVRWIQMDYNAGFARANNAGIRQSVGDTVLLLNSDTLDVEDAVGKCYTLFSASPHVACGVQLLNADGTPQISGNYFMWGGLNNLLPLPYVGPFIRWLGASLSVKRPHVPEAAAEVPVDWINGAFLMVNKGAIEKAGLLDEDFFLYAEEAEWCYRLGKFGKMVIYGQCKVLHLQGQTSNTAFDSSSTGYQNLYDRKGLQIMLSNFVRIRKQFGVGWYVFHLMAYTATVPVFFTGKFLGNVFRTKNRLPHMKAPKGFAGNVIALWKFAGVIIRNKPHFYKVL